MFGMKCQYQIKIFSLGLMCDVLNLAQKADGKSQMIVFCLGLCITQIYQTPP